MTDMTQIQHRGGAFLIEDMSPDEMFTPEDFSDEQRAFAQAARDFMEKEVFPLIPRIEAMEPGLTPKVLRKAAEVGLLQVDVPVEYGGLGLDKISSMLVSEQVGQYGSFAVSFGAHTGIGTLPITFFGSPEQKQRYLPRLATGEMLAAYALTEPGSGSDALAARTTAVLNEANTHYVLNGTKMWITNAGFADIFIVFAKVDGEKSKFSAFIVEKEFSGVSTGVEEHKMGIKGSSTRMLNLDNVPVPVENLIGEVGGGGKIALNILNIGRFKLGGGVTGGMKLALNHSLKYAMERVQFGVPIVSFGLIQSKLAEMCMNTYVAETMVYRTAGLIEAALADVDVNDTRTYLRRIEEYSTECSIMKVYCSELLDAVVDEGVQILGGMGYSAEYPLERAYRDSRINRIFEGTNEINRMVAIGQLLRKAMGGKLPIIPILQEITVDALSHSAADSPTDEPIEGREGWWVAQAKKVTLFTAGVAVQHFMKDLQNQQEVMASLSDLLMDVYAMESVLLRTMKRMASGAEDVQLELDITRNFFNDALDRLNKNARQVLAVCATGDTLLKQLQAVERFTRHLPINTVETRRRIAERLIARTEYPY